MNCIFVNNDASHWAFNLGETVWRRVKTSRDPFIIQKLLEQAGGDLGRLTDSGALMVLEKADADINRAELDTIYREAGLR